MENYDNEDNALRGNIIFSKVVRHDKDVIDDFMLEIESVMIKYKVLRMDVFLDTFKIKQR